MKACNFTNLVPHNWCISKNFFSFQEQLFCDYLGTVTFVFFVWNSSFFCSFLSVKEGKIFSQQLFKIFFSCHHCILNSDFIGYFCKDNRINLWPNVVSTLATENSPWKELDIFSKILRNCEIPIYTRIQKIWMNANHCAESKIIEIPTDQI